MSKSNHLYFICDARRAAVKIGITNNPEKRLKDLQAGNHTRLRLDLVLTFETGEAAWKYEDALHQMFARYWRHREWFTYSPTIKTFAATWHAGEVPDVIWPVMSSKRATIDYGAMLSKEEYLAILRDKARSQ